MYIYICIYNKKKIRTDFDRKSISYKHAGFRMLLKKRRSKEWKKFKTTTKSRVQNNITQREKLLNTMIVLKLVQIRVEAILITDTIL